MNNSPIPGMLTREELTKAIRRDEIDTVLAVFPDMYGRLMGKRLTGHFFLEHAAEDGMHVCDYLLACDMEMDPVPGYKFTSWETGYGDMHWVPDWTTARRTAWLPKTALLLGDMQTATGEKPVEVAPRQMLKRQLERAREMGFKVMGGSEIEVYVFHETYESAREKRYHGLKTSGSYIEDYHILQGTKEEDLIGAIRRHLDASGVPVESSKGEWGPGQQEINLLYCDALTQADRNVLYKHAAKEIAQSQGKAVTFMAKWDETLAGSSMHVHLSLWKMDGGNAFTGETPLGPIASSETFRGFLGGLLHHAQALTACFAPNVASYKRFQSGSFAPTGIAWSRDNRTAGMRVVGHGNSLRVECRIPGADANPYIVYAALIAAGLDGIANKIEPSPIFEGDIYQAAGLPRVPGCLRDAITAFEQSELPQTAFGSDVKEHYLHFLRTEQRKFDEVVTDWEKTRFFERV